MSRRLSNRTVVTWPPVAENGTLAATPQQQPPEVNTNPNVLASNSMPGEGGYQPPLERFVANGGPSKNVLIVVAVLAAYYLWTKNQTRE